VCKWTEERERERENEIRGFDKQEKDTKTLKDESEKVL
jgi:hypothetical protein